MTSKLARLAVLVRSSFRVERRILGAFWCFLGRQKRQLARLDKVAWVLEPATAVFREDERTRATVADHRAGFYVVADELSK